ncbi:heme exporter protein CcmD [Thalassotalea euphylliae]|uniref:Heme exporter protein D n=1 Tax=Thalassotalea euphylliae TaxID=1655234 RepID=A0A3E0UJK0_9GAMM|nr:heme exporter protein CcmD [Thalassotalea euphylliae]REL31777.1 heme exporter protein CcmD [Thalassotalea euphylliae]REL36724.1 heme exporter protein CcmD [Thalassotalea euphylliae]
MQFDSFSAFLDMGGYGFFVWLSYGASIVLFLLLIVSSLKASKAIKGQIASQIKREQKLKLAAEQQAAQQAKS